MADFDAHDKDRFDCVISFNRMSACTNMHLYEEDGFISYSSHRLD